MMAESKPICSADGCIKVSERYFGDVRYCNMHFARMKRRGTLSISRNSPIETLAWIEEHASFDGDDCLFWPFGRTQRGYAIRKSKGSSPLVHREMCEHRNGPPPTEKHEAAHSCGNGHLGCVNPNHLRWATHAENMADMEVHGTIAKGEGIDQSKLTADDVLSIRRSKNCSGRDLAKRYGVAPSTISMIRKRKNWAWLED